MIHVLAVFLIFHIMFEWTAAIILDVPCPAGTWFNINSCDPCSPGTFSDTSGVSFCNGCPAGYSQRDEGQTKCTRCKANTFTSVAQTVRCTRCPVGWGQTETAAQTCTQCTSGMYGPTQGVGCVKCNRGKFQINPGQDSCTPCPIGESQESYGATECVQCLEGKYQDVVGQVACKECTGNQYQDEPGQTQCKTCSGGSVTADQQCTDCGVGKYSTNGECVDCQAGQFQNQIGQPACKECTSGRFIPISGRDRECIECPEGRYQHNQGQTACLACSTGRYENEAGSTVCKKCTYGKYLDDVGLTDAADCKSCPTGYKTSFEGLDTCTQCDVQANEIPNSAQSGCQTCPSGRFTNDAVVCEYCPLGFIPKNASEYTIDSTQVVDETCPVGYETIMESYQVTVVHDGVWQQESRWRLKECQANLTTFDGACKPCPTDQTTTAIVRGTCVDTCKSGQTRTIGVDECEHCPLTTLKLNDKNEYECSQCPLGKTFSTEIPKTWALYQETTKCWNNVFGSCSIPGANNAALNTPALCKEAAENYAWYEGYKCTLGSNFWHKETLCKMYAFDAYWSPGVFEFVPEENLEIRDRGATDYWKPGRYGFEGGHPQKAHRLATQESSLEACQERCQADNKTHASYLREDYDNFNTGYCYCSDGCENRPSGQSEMGDTHYDVYSFEQHIMLHFRQCKDDTLSLLTYGDSGTYGNTHTCPVGTQLNVSSHSCEQCDPGRYAEKWNSSSCIACPAGYWQSESTSSSCTRCTPGKSMATPGSTSPSACKECAAGRRGPTTDESQGCVDCPKGTFQLYSGKTICYPCPAHTFNDQVGLAEKCTLSPYTLFEGQQAEWKFIDGSLNESLFHFEHDTGLTKMFKHSLQDTFFDTGLKFIDSSSSCPVEHSNIGTDINLNYFGLPSSSEMQYNSFVTKETITLENAITKLSGLCSDDDMMNILTEVECREYATASGIEFDVVVDNDERPPGCYQFYASKIYFNEALHSESACSNNRRCICYREMHTILTSGKCEDQGMVIINTAQECQAMAEAIGENYGGLVAGTDRPFGCYQFTNYGSGNMDFYFNYVMSSTFDCNQQRSCVCIVPEVTSQYECERSSPTPTHWKGVHEDASKPKGCVFEISSGDTFWNTHATGSWTQSDSYALRRPIGQMKSKTTGEEKDICFADYANPVARGECPDYAALNSYEMCMFYAQMSGETFNPIPKNEPRRLKGCIKTSTEVFWNVQGLLPDFPFNRCESVAEGMGFSFGGSIYTHNNILGNKDCASFDWEPGTLYNFGAASWGDGFVDAVQIDKAGNTCAGGTTNTDYVNCKEIAEVFGVSVTTQQNDFVEGKGDNFICPEDFTGYPLVTDQASFETQADICDGNDGLWHESLRSGLCSDTDITKTIQLVEADKSRECAKKCSETHGSNYFSIYENAAIAEQQCLCSTGTCPAETATYKTITSETCGAGWKGPSSKDTCERLLPSSERSFPDSAFDKSTTTSQSTTTTMYIELTSSSCTAENHAHLSNAQCDEVAGYDVGTETSSWYPPGCYRYGVTSYYFNLNANSEVSCTSGNKKCQCLQTTTTVETTTTTETIQFTDLHMFQILGGTCADQNADMTTEDECRYRAQQLGVTFGVEEETGWPAGCYLIGSNIYWNTNLASTNACNSGNRLCQCKARVSDIFELTSGAGCSAASAVKLDVAECETRAGQLGVDWKGTEDTASWPPGCYYIKTGTPRVWFNTNLDSPTQCSQANWCQCKAAVPEIKTPLEIFQELYEQAQCHNRNGWEMIRDTETCAIRAQQLELSYLGAFSSTGWPPGCWKYTTDGEVQGLYFNNQLDSSTDCRYSSAKCQCRLSLKPAKTVLTTPVEAGNNICSDWFNPAVGINDQSDLTSTKWNTPELCLERCRIFVPGATKMFMIDGNKCGCSVSGTCPSGGPMITYTYDILSTDHATCEDDGKATITDKSECESINNADTTIHYGSGDSSLSWLTFTEPSDNRGATGCSVYSDYVYYRSQANSGNAFGDCTYYWYGEQSYYGCVCKTPQPHSILSGSASVTYEVQSNADKNGCLYDSTNDIVMYNGDGTGSTCDSSQGYGCLCDRYGEGNYQSYSITPPPYPSQYPTYTQCSGDTIETGECYHSLMDMNMCEAYAKTSVQNFYVTAYAGWPTGCFQHQNQDFYYNSLAGNDEADGHTPILKKGPTGYANAQCAMENDNGAAVVGWYYDVVDTSSKKPGCVASANLISAAYPLEEKLCSPVPDISASLACAEGFVRDVTTIPSSIALKYTTEYYAEHCDTTCTGYLGFYYDDATKRCTCFDEDCTGIVPIDYESYTRDKLSIQGEWSKKIISTDIPDLYNAYGDLIASLNGTLEIPDKLSLVGAVCTIPGLVSESSDVRFLGNNSVYYTLGKQCIQCEPGKYKSVDTCVICEQGKYSASGQNICCEPNQAFNYATQTCDSCASNEYSLYGNECKTCPYGTIPSGDQPGICTIQCQGVCENTPECSSIVHKSKCLSNEACRWNRMGTSSNCEMTLEEFISETLKDWPPATFLDSTSTIKRLHNNLDRLGHFEWASTPNNQYFCRIPDGTNPDPITNEASCEIQPLVDRTRLIREYELEFGVRVEFKQKWDGTVSEDLLVFRPEKIMYVDADGDGAPSETFRRVGVDFPIQAGYVFGCTTNSISGCDPANIEFDCDDSDPQKLVVDECNVCGGDGSWFDECGQCNGVGILNELGTQCLSADSMIFGPRDSFLGDIDKVDAYANKRITFRKEKGIITIQDESTPLVKTNTCMMADDAMSSYCQNDVEFQVYNDSGVFLNCIMDGDPPEPICSGLKDLGIDVSDVQMTNDGHRICIQYGSTLDCRYSNKPFLRKNVNLNQTTASVPERAVQHFECKPSHTPYQDCGGHSNCLSGSQAESLCSSFNDEPTCNNNHWCSWTDRDYGPSGWNCVVENIVLYNRYWVSLNPEFNPDTNILACHLRSREDCDAGGFFYGCVWSNQIYGPAENIPSVEGWDIETDWVVDGVYGDQYYVNRRTNETQWTTPEPIEMGCRPIDPMYLDVCASETSKIACLEEMPTRNLCKWLSMTEEVIPDTVRFFKKRSPYGKHMFDDVSHDHFGHREYFRLTSPTEFLKRTLPLEFVPGEILATNINSFGLNPVSGTVCWISEDETGHCDNNEVLGFIDRQPQNAIVRIKSIESAETRDSTMNIYKTRTGSSLCKTMWEPPPVYEATYSIATEGAYCADSVNAITNTTEKITYNYAWKTPEQCMKRCLELNPDTTAFYIITGVHCACSLTTSGNCPIKRSGYQNDFDSEIWFLAYFLEYSGPKYITYTINADVRNSPLFRENFVDECALRCEQDTTYSTGNIIVQSFDMTTVQLNNAPPANNICYCTADPCIFTKSNFISREHTHVTQTFAKYRYAIGRFTGEDTTVDSRLQASRGIHHVSRNGYFATRWHTVLRPKYLSPRFEVDKFEYVDQTIGRCVEEFGLVTCDYSTRGSLFVYNASWIPMCYWATSFCESVTDDIIWSSRCYDLSEDECKRNEPWSPLPSVAITVPGKLVAASNTGHCVRGVETNDLRCWYLTNYTDHLMEEFAFDNHPKSSFTFEDGHVTMTDSKTCVGQFMSGDSHYPRFTCWRNGGRLVGSFSVLDTMDDATALGTNETNFDTTALRIGCLKPDACNFDPSADIDAPYNHIDSCWFPFDYENYTCGDSTHSPVFDGYTQTWVINPGKCIHNDTDNNGWCDEMDEVFGCLDPSACNPGGSMNRDDLKRTLGSGCDTHAQCISGRCAVCFGEYKCSKPDDDARGFPICTASKRNKEVITRHVSSFCRYPYSSEFKCKKNDIFFSSLQGVEVPSNGDLTVDAYIKSDVQVRESMLRCIDLPDAASICASLHVNQCEFKKRSLQSGNEYFPMDACCKCGGGRIFDTSRGEPFEDLNKIGIPQSWQEEGCLDPTACNYNPFADAIKTAGKCKYNDANHDGVCDDILQDMEKKCGVFSASNFDPNIDPLKHVVDNSVCEFDETLNTDQCVAYAPKIGCTIRSACNYAEHATEDAGTCIWPENGLDCDGNKIIEERTTCDGTLFIENGQYADCVSSMEFYDTCYPVCNDGFSSVHLNRTCNIDGTMSPFKCERTCSNTQYFNTSSSELNPCVNYTTCENFQHISYFGSPTRDIECTQNQCLCVNGVPFTNASCTKHKDIQCHTCDFGYHVEDNICVENTCSCDIGEKINSFTNWRKGNCSKELSFNETQCKLAAHNDFWSPAHCNNQNSPGAYCKNATHLFTEEDCESSNYTWLSDRDACLEAGPSIDDVWSAGFCDGDPLLLEFQCFNSIEYAKGPHQNFWCNDANVTNRTWIPPTCQEYPNVTAHCSGALSLITESSCNVVPASLQPGRCEGYANATQHCEGAPQFNDDPDLCSSIAYSWISNLCIGNSTLNNNESECKAQNESWWVHEECQDAPEMNKTQCESIRWVSEEQDCIESNLITTWVAPICELQPLLTEEECLLVKWLDHKEACQVELNNAWVPDMCKGQTGIIEDACIIQAEHEWWVPSICEGNSKFNNDEQQCIESGNLKCPAHNVQYCDSCFEGVAFLDTFDSTCIPYTDCIPTEHESVAPGKYRDRECAKNKCICPNGIVGTCLTHESITCTSCSDGFFMINGQCVKHKTCDNQTEYVQHEGTNSSDTVCSLKACTCSQPLGRGNTGEKCPEHGADSCFECEEGEFMQWGLCRTCASGSYLHGNICVPWSDECTDDSVEIIRPSSTNDRLCSIRAKCSNGAGTHSKHLHKHKKYYDTAPALRSKRLRSYHKRLRSYRRYLSYPSSSSTMDPTKKSESIDPTKKSESVVTIQYGYKQVMACPGSKIQVEWSGRHNIIETQTSDCDSIDGQEIIGFKNSGFVRLFDRDELTALPGERRYFKSGQHCGKTSARFEVYCPRNVNVQFGFDKVIACPGDKLNVNWSGRHNIRESKSCDDTDGNIILDYKESGHVENLDSLVALPGTTRYFKCDEHCGESSARFEVSCPIQCPNVVKDVDHCEFCDDGYYLKNHGDHSTCEEWSVCPDDAFEISPPSGTRDRKCSDTSFNQCKCPHGIAKNGTDCPYHKVKTKLKYGEGTSQCAYCDEMYELDGTECKRAECHPYEIDVGLDSDGNIMCESLLDVKNCSDIKIQFNVRPLGDIQPSCHECKNTTYCESLQRLWEKCDKCSLGM